MLPTAILAKAHMPDLAKVVPAFNVESIEGTEALTQHLVRKVEFESLDFNKRFIATVPKEYDPVALRELFSPGFLEWTTTMTGEIDFGVNDRQLWFLWRLGERSRAGAEGGAEERRPALRAASRGRWRRTASTPTRRAPGTPAWSRSPTRAASRSSRRQRGSASARAAASRLLGARPAPAARRARRRRPAARFAQRRPGTAVSWRAARRGRAAATS